MGLGKGKESEGTPLGVTMCMSAHMAPLEHFYRALVWVIRVWDAAVAAAVWGMGLGHVMLMPYFGRYVEGTQGTDRMGNLSGDLWEDMRLLVEYMDVWRVKMYSSKSNPYFGSS